MATKNANGTVKGEVSNRDAAPGDAAAPVNRMAEYNAEIERKRAEAETAVKAKAAAVAKFAAAVEAAAEAERQERNRLEAAATYAADTYLGKLERGQIRGVRPRVWKETAAVLDAKGKPQKYREAADGRKLKNATYVTLPCDAFPSTAEEAAKFADAKATKLAEGVSDRGGFLETGLSVADANDLLADLVEFFGFAPAEKAK